MTFGFEMEPFISHERCKILNYSWKSPRSLSKICKFYFVLFGIDQCYLEFNEQERGLEKYLHLKNIPKII